MRKQIEEADIAPFRDFPAKSSRDTKEKWLPLYMHSLDAAGIMEKLIRRWLPDSVVNAVGLPEEEFIRVAVFLAATHDEGKLGAVFIEKISIALSGIVRERLVRDGFLDAEKRRMGVKDLRHTVTGEMILRETGCPVAYASMVGGHHGRPTGREEREGAMIEAYPRSYFGNADTEKWRSVWNAAYHFARKRAGYQEGEEFPKLTVPAQVLLTGLLIVADWIASNPEYFPLLPVESTGSLTEYPQRVDQAWSILGFTESWNPCCFGINAKIFRERFGFELRPVQEMVLKAVQETGQPGLYILEAGMGTGKTEAALAAAELLATKAGCGGLYIGLPTQATANGIFPRLESWAERQAQKDCVTLSIRLAHGMATLNKEYNALFSGDASMEDAVPEELLIVHEWFQGRKQALLADFVIGTIDQLLMMSLRKRHVFLRHLGLAGKVVIIDEAHSYDVYMSVYLDMALKWLGAYKIPVIVLSATLPEKRRKELVLAYQSKRRSSAEEWQRSREYPLLTWTDGKTVNQRSVEEKGIVRQVRIEKLLEKNLIPYLVNAATENACVGVIVNTVGKAQEIAQALYDAKPDGVEVILFHSRYTAEDRARIEEKLLRRLGKESGEPERQRLIVVATQVLEQSLDIDLDVLVSELCPMDLLLQRIGRLWRHALHGRPPGFTEAKCLLLCTEDELYGEGTKKVYHELLLRRTAAKLKDVIELPKDIPELVQDVYELENDLMERTAEYCRLEENFLLNEGKRREKAEGYCITKPTTDAGNTLSDWLSNDAGEDNVSAEASVRDGGAAGIEVLLMVLRQDKITFLPWQDEGEVFRGYDIPAEEEARKILRQRIRLPKEFSGKRYEETIAELEKWKKQAPEWEWSPWLRNEYILFLDETFSTELCGYRLVYSKEFGLINSTLSPEGKEEG